jgi:outer membrane protein TolC
LTPSAGGALHTHAGLASTTTIQRPGFPDDERAASMMSRPTHRRHAGRHAAAPAARALLSAVVVALMAAGAAPGRAAAQSLTDTVRATLGSNPELGAARTGRLAVDQELSQARAGYLPSLEARASVGPSTRSRPATGAASTATTTRCSAGPTPRSGSASDSSTASRPRARWRASARA